MALLNYTSQYSNISPYLNAISGSSDWLRIFISPDVAGSGHFITHGIDFGASYVGGQRGLVPANSGTLAKTYLRGDGWSALWTSADEAASAVGETDAQKLAAKEAYLQSALVSAYDIKQWIVQSFAANSAMRFKGVITIDGEGNISNTTDVGTASGFPTYCEVGDTYKISGATVDDSSYIAGEVVSTGDMIVCIKSGTGASLNSGQYWTVVQDNVEHLIYYTFNGRAYRLYAQTAENITLFAPTTAGIDGQVLISKGSGNAPDWVNAATLVVAEAAKVTYSLVKGTGLSMTNQGSPENSYDGSKTITISLVQASTTALGGVIIDDGTNSEAYNSVNNTLHTLYPTITMDNGQIYLTRDNIVNALGYDPISAIPVFTDSADGLVPKASTANKQTNNIDNVAVAATYLLGADAKWYKLPASSFQGDRRIVKLNSTTVIDAASGNALDIIAGDHVNILAEQVSNEYTGKITFNAIWRDIQVRTIANSSISQYVTSIGNNDPLVFDNSESVFMLGEDVTVGSGANATHKTVIKSYITWYNMDTQEYETV